MKNCHRDARLDALLGKTVRITFFDGDVWTGVLVITARWLGAPSECEYYGLMGSISKGRITTGGTLIFRKSHVRKIEVVR